MTSGRPLGNVNDGSNPGHLKYILSFLNNRGELVYLRWSDGYVGLKIQGFQVHSNDPS